MEAHPDLFPRDVFPLVKQPQKPVMMLSQLHSIRHVRRRQVFTWSKCHNLVPDILDSNESKVVLENA